MGSVCVNVDARYEDTMDSTKDRIGGMVEEAKRKGEGAVGQARGDGQIQAEGQRDETSGKVQQCVADVKDKASDLLEKAKDKIGQ